MLQSLMKFLLVFSILTISSYGITPKEELTETLVLELDARYEFTKTEFKTFMINNEMAWKKAEFEHELSKAKHSRQAYEAHYWMTWLIFFLVSILVLGGVYLSFLQFKKADGQASNKASLKISKDGIEFNSSVIGLTILFMSFMFFYTYIEHVYKIEYITTPKQELQYDSNKSY